MNGREDRKLNDLFFVCSLIEYVARKTKNERKIIVNALGHTGLEHFYDLAEVYHCENIDKVTSEIINKYFKFRKFNLQFLIYKCRKYVSYLPPC